MRALTLSSIILVSLAAGCGGGESAAPGNAPKPAASAPAKAPNKAQQQAKDNAGRVRDIQAKCAETTDEGKTVLEKVQAWNPVVNERKADLPLKQIADDFVSKGIYEVCWSATKKSSGKWKVGFNYIDVGGAFKEAEWEYDPATGDAKPFNQDAITFWTGKI